MSAKGTPTSQLPWVATGVLLLGAYLLAPAVVLFRLDRAVRAGDGATVARLVDFPAVRRGLAAEVAGGALATAPGARAAADTGLPPFGFSFVSHIADTEMATRLTPGGLIRLARQDRAAAGPRLRPRFAGAWFDSPRQLVVRLRLADERRPVRLRLRLELGGWKLAGVWLPPALLRQAADRGPGDGAAPGRSGGTGTQLAASPAAR
jgi:Protein of unknown function (DUF2939)